MIDAHPGFLNSALQRDKSAQACLGDGGLLRVGVGAAPGSVTRLTRLTLTCEQGAGALRPQRLRFSPLARHRFNVKSNEITGIQHWQPGATGAIHLSVERAGHTLAACTLISDHTHTHIASGFIRVYLYG